MNPIDDSNFLIDFVNNIPVAFFEVLCQILARIVARAIFDPKLIDHTHFLIDFHLFFGFKNNTL